MEESKDLKEVVQELADNLGTVGLFMLGETRALMKKSWGASKEEFMDAVDKASDSMKKSGKVAWEDIDRASDQIKKNWELFDRHNNLEWGTFLSEFQARMKTIGEVTHETFDLSVDQAKKTLDSYWTASGRVGEDQFKALQKGSEDMAEAFKKQWDFFCDHVEKTGKTVERATEAVWDELKKRK
ncbi:hypothetical protein ACFL2Q_05325 [Thermodesulfobacteriota bacterium]